MELFVENGSMVPSTRKEVLQMQLRGPKPAPLSVSKSSTKIKKTCYEKRSNTVPVIVYLESPKVIHASPEEFMFLVQQLTGKD